MTPDVQERPLTKPARPLPVATEPGVAPVRLRWWYEVAFAATFYVVYTGIRNQFGSAAVSPTHALNNAERVIDVEQAMGLFHEELVQSWFLDWNWFLRFWNVFYGSLHFVVTLFVMVWLFRRFPERYRQYRNVLAATTALALVGFATFPLMPPRLLSDCGPYGGCQTGYDFVDTLARVGGLWSFDSGTMQQLSNQYAAMPSLHFAWATWCLLAMFPILRRRTGRLFFLAYPAGTLFAIVVTANHYWIDAVGGAVVLALGFVVGTAALRLSEEIRGRLRSPGAGPLASVGSGNAHSASADQPED